MSNYLFEAVEENARLVSDMTALVMQWAEGIRNNPVSQIQFSQLPGYDKLAKRYQDNELFQKNIQDIEKLNIYFFGSNEEASKSDPWYNHFKQKNEIISGYYLPGQYRISIFYEELLNQVKSKLKNAAIKSMVRKVISHEIRHFMQYQAYPDYFYNKKMLATAYRKRSVEIDAVFYEIISNIDVYRFIENPSEYVKLVMNILQQHRDLNPSQVKNYRKQAASFFAKRIDKNLQNEWEKAVKIAMSNQRMIHNPEIFVGEVMDMLENYIRDMHFREMKYRVYVYYRKKTMDYYREQFKGQGINDRVNSLYAVVYPVFVAHLRNLIPQITNSRIGQGQAIKQVLDATRNEMQRRGTKVNSKVYSALEQKLQDRVAEIVKNFSR